ncbi:MAG TPA: PAS domain-containing protein [Methanosarcina sp.]|nr:PAS domain-containing protein [Methanosarcina sp.]
MAKFGKILPNFGRVKTVVQTEYHKFDTSVLEHSFNNLQSVLQETSSLANAISATLDRKEIVDRRLSTILQVISDGIVVKDATGHWVYINDAVKHLFQFESDEDWKDRTDYSICLDRPDLEEVFEKSRDYDQKAWESEKPFYSEESFTCSEGVHTFSIVRTPLFNDDGSRNCLIYVARDITELTEKRRNIYVAYKALNASSDLVAITDENGKIIFANDTFARVYKFVDPRDLIGKNMSILRSPHTKIETYQALWATIKAGRVWQHEMVNLDHEGNEVVVENTILPVVDQELHTPFFICIGILR